MSTALNQASAFTFLLLVYSLLHGEIIEEYPNDYPHPSCLVLGLNPAGKAPHIVCGISEDTLWLITAYSPNPAEWSADFKTRKERTP
jgi:hypothetical protein